MKVINDHLAQKQTLEFCEFLSAKQPLPQEITLQLQVPALAKFGGVPFVFGVYDYTNKLMLISTYYQTTEPAKFLHTIAHEYRHAQQVFQGMIKTDRIVAGFVWDGAAEADAEQFAENIVHNFFAEGEHIEERKRQDPGQMTRHRKCRL